MSYYVERSVRGRIEWLKVVPAGEFWIGCFCLIGEIPAEHKPS
jgi:hypothetical protein